MQKVVIQERTHLAHAIKKRRKELGLTQQQLADLSNLSLNGISQLEIGNKDTQLSTLLKLAPILGFKLTLDMDE